MSAALSNKLKYAVLGVGRMGQRHALNVAFRAPRAELVAVADLKPSTPQWMKDNLPPSTKYFESYEDCLANSGADAVLIASATSWHASMAIDAMHAGKVNFSMWTVLFYADFSLACLIGEAYFDRSRNLQACRQ